MGEQPMATQYHPTSVSPPGETLRELLEERGMTQADLAERAGRPRKTINEIMQGKAAITPETALQFELVLGIPASFWNARESRYREFLARLAEVARLAELSGWVKEFPFTEMAKRGWVASTRDPGGRAKAVLEFFGVASPEQWASVHDRLAVSFRKSKTFKPSEKALAAWLRMGARTAERTQCEPYDENQFRRCLNEVRGLTREGPEVFQAKLQEACCLAGVAVVFVPQLKGSRANGATRWISPQKALIQLSIRYKTEDHLWFTFFHEAAHILLHKRRAVFLEFGGQDGKEEEEADRFAADFLIPREDFSRFLSEPTPSKAVIYEFAKEVGVSPGIVVGRLQHERLLPHNHCNDLKMKLEWAEVG